MRELHPGYKCVIPEMLECLERADRALSEATQEAIALLDETNDNSIRDFCHELIAHFGQMRKNIAEEKNGLVSG